MIDHRSHIRVLARLARRRSGRQRRDTLLLIVAVALPVSLGALIGPVLFGPDPFALVIVAVLTGTVALSVGAVLATSTKSRILRYGRLAAIGADPTQVRILLFFESAAPTAVGFVAGLLAGLGASLTFGPMRWILDDRRPTDSATWPLIATVAGISAVLLAATSVIGLWLASAPAAAMALRAPIESLGARAPEPEPRRFQGWVGLALVIGAIVYCVTADTFIYGLLILAVAAVFAGLHLITVPSLIVLDRWSNTLPRPLRLAVRNAARNRTRFGRLTMASLATVSLGIMGAAGIQSDSRDNPASGRSHPMDERFVIVPEATLEAGGDELAGGVEKILSVETTAEFEVYFPSLERVHTEAEIHSQNVVVVAATPDLLDALDADPETRAAIERGAFVAPNGTSGEVRFSDRATAEPFHTHPARLGLGDTSPIGTGPGAHLRGDIVLLNPERVVELGVDLVRPEWGRRSERHLLVVAERPITGDQRAALTDELRGIVLVSDQDLSVGGVSLDRIIAAVAAAFLLVFGLLGGALSGTETDREVSAMVANGASPSIRRWFRATQVGLQLLVAGVIGAPVGVLLFWAVTRTDPTVPDPIVPGESVVALVVIVPVVTAALAGLLTSDGTPAVSRRALA